jgi:pimeloyl-ACP methyl ester carboxylesterase
MPVMVIAGAEDTKFVEIAKRLVDAIGSNAIFKAIANTGHSPHLEQPELVEVALDEFLSQPLIC